MDRRNFLQNAFAIAGAARLATPGLSAFAEQPHVSAPPMPDDVLFERNEDEYWRQIRRQFIIPEDEIFLNNGTNGSCPLPVLKEVFDTYYSTESLDQPDPDDWPIWGYFPSNEVRDPLAQFLGISRDELALTRNATESNNYMTNGLDMNPGDEVLISDQEHPSGKEPWRLRAKRYGIVVKQYEIPKPLTDASELLNRINDAITPRTRVLFTSHITTTTGAVQPVKQICDLARTKGLVSMIDGAQVSGAMRLNLREIGCDMYSSSPHKWLMAPKGSGFLYVRDEMIDRMWSTITAGEWDNKAVRAERFQHFGTSNVPQLYGLRAAVEFANRIGIDRIEKRNRQLSDYMWSKMKERGAENVTGDGQFRCAIVSVSVPPVPIHQLFLALWSKYKIRIRGGGGVHNGIRISTPYYIQKPDIDRFAEKFDEFKRTYKATA
jgi:isopenicillin-N epimerase